MKEPMKSHIPNNFYIHPETCWAMFSRKELHETLMVTSGRIIAKGVSWDIVHKHLGAGAYRVIVKKHDFSKDPPGLPTMDR